jgi:hypothetical protein
MSSPELDAGDGAKTGVPGFCLGGGGTPVNLAAQDLERGSFRRRAFCRASRMRADSLKPGRDDENIPGLASAGLFEFENISRRGISLQSKECCS